jgi:hypothetical protein
MAKECLLEIIDGTLTAATAVHSFSVFETC